MRRFGEKGRVVIPFAATLLWLLVALPGQTAVSAAADWKTGRAFQRALANRFQVVSWPEGRRFRDQLGALAERQRVAIFLDRRIDPEQSISLSVRDITFAELLNQLAAQVDAVVVHVGSVVYIGPRDQLAELSRLAEQRALNARALQDGGGGAPLRTRAWQWEALAEPRQLLMELAEEANVKIDGIDKIPHDLWPQTKLPPLRWTDRMTLVLAGFGFTFRLAEQGEVVQLVRLPAPEFMVRTYTAALSSQAWERLGQQFPEAEIQRLADGIQFRGTRVEHTRLQEFLSQQAAPRDARPPRGNTVHSLRVDRQPVGAILKTMEAQLDLRVELEAAVREKLHTRVSFDLKNVAIEKLLEATLTPASLTFERHGNVIRIKRRPGTGN